MTNAALVKNLRKLVEVEGAAQVAVWLGYKDTRSISTWLGNRHIPKVRRELVKSVIEKQQPKQGA